MVVTHSVGISIHSIYAEYAKPGKHADSKQNGSRCCYLSIAVLIASVEVDTVNVFVRCTLNTPNPVYPPTALSKLASRRGVAGGVIDLFMVCGLDALNRK